MRINILDEVLVNGEIISVDEMVMDLRWGEYFPAGFAKLEVTTPSKLFLLIPDPYDVEVELAPGIKSPVFLLDGIKVCGFWNREVLVGQKFQVHFIYERPYYVTRQTIWMPKVD